MTIIAAVIKDCVHLQVLIAMASRCRDIARSLNTLLEFPSEDQQSPLEVIQDYSTCSAGSDVDSDDNFSEDSDIEPMSGIIIALKYKKKKKYNKQHIQSNLDLLK